MEVIVRSLTVLLLPPMFVAAAGMLVHGYQGTGGGFAAGVVAGVGALLLLLAAGSEAAERLLPIARARYLAAAGLALMLAVAFGPALLGGAPPLTHAPAPGAKVHHLGALELHTSLLFDLGVALAVFGVLLTVFDIVAREEEEDGEAGP